MAIRLNSSTCYFFSVASLLTTLMVPQAQAGCDPCMKAAATAANSTMTSGLASTTAAVDANVAATSTLNASVQAANVGIGSAIQANNKLLLSGIDASTNRLEMAIQQNTKTEERLTDHVLETLVSALKQAHVANQNDWHNKTLGPVSRPLSGDIGANRAPLLKQGIVQNQQIWEQMTKQMHEWNEDTTVADEGHAALRVAKILAEPEEVWNTLPMLTKNQVTEEESLKLQRLLTVLVNPNPLPKVADTEIASNAKAAEYELNRKLHNAELDLVFSVLSKPLADRQPTIPISTNDWQQGYVTSEPDSNGKTSFLSMLESETLGRLGSEGWYLDIKTKTEAGILREQVYQQAIRNQMLLYKLKQEEQNVLMLALIAKHDIQEDKPIPPSKSP